ncbi:hypothetical protein NBE98_04035 [Clostridium swellfunianum]|uniref:hypothetical protein n=1 Tax=Clostridium swellfunianum TaxID=1367462 RepID=UPI00202F80C8|nr:hypothetical protein [Clostridium swellfunianum]MCM0647549.1 hypothetical protein [Clostridium swellfunianum]
MAISKVKSMLRRIFFYDFLTGLIISSILFFTYRQYAGILLLGLSIAVINFIIGGILTERVVIINKSPSIFFVLVKILSVLLICLIPILLFKDNMYFILVYMLGFTSHFIALILYALFDKKVN